MKATPIVALDVASAELALALVRRLGDYCRFYKVGSELFTVAGPDLVRRIRDDGNDVFLDLKFHDIPNTVRRAVESAAGLGVRLVTAHASGGRQMLEAAVEGAAARCGVLAVSVLTSLDGRELAESWGRPSLVVEVEVMRLARLAAAAGAQGIVCSGAEARAVRIELGNRFELLVPGIRLPGAETHDQARAVTPAEAVAAGATYLVLGRTVTGAADPRAAMEEVRRSMNG